MNRHTLAILALLSAAAFHHAFGGDITFAVRYDDWGELKSVLECADYRDATFAILMEEDQARGAPVRRPVYAGRVDATHIDPASGALTRLNNRGMTKGMSSGSFDLWNAVPSSWDATRVTTGTRFILVFFKSGTPGARIKNIDYDASWYQTSHMHNIQAGENGGISVEFRLYPNTSWLGMAPATPHPANAGVFERETVPVPEPSTATLLAIAFATLALSRRKKDLVKK